MTIHQRAGRFESQTNHRSVTDQVRILNPKIEVGPGLPKSNVIILELEQNARVIVRPSGTEPKVKYYFNLSGERRDARAISPA